MRLTVRVSDRDASERFYATVLRTLAPKWDDLTLLPAEDDAHVTRRLHVGFAAPSREHVDEFWRVGTAAGYRNDGEPGPRPQYTPDYYGSFLLDPDGNSAEAVHHGDVPAGSIDHVWIRVADLGASRDSYEAVAARAGFRLDSHTPEHAHFVGAEGSFSLVAGEPTENFQVALGNNVELVGHNR